MNHIVKVCFMKHVMKNTRWRFVGSGLSNRFEITHIEGSAITTEVLPNFEYTLVHHSREWIS